MAARNAQRATQVPSTSVPLPIHFRRLFRAHVEPQCWGGVEVTAFVEAASREAAVRKISQAITAIEGGSTVESVTERIYNCTPASELVDEGLGEDLEGRLMETGWGGGKPICFVDHPLVLLSDPAPLLRVWARVTQAVMP
jgi:hypothetical protein